MCCEILMKRLNIYFSIAFGVLAICVIAINFAIHTRTSAYIYTEATVPYAQAVVIPGAAILQSGALSEIFRERVDLAIRLYEAGKVSKILVSGDNSTVSHNEVNPVRKYLLAKGIPDSDIFLDHAGFDTYSTVYRARDIFQVTSLIVASQSFHLPRAVFLARALGVTAYGVSADVGRVDFRNDLREILADEKAVMDLAFHRKPKYLGDVIPISGDGSQYR